MNEAKSKKWKRSEIDILVSMKEQGHTYQSIGVALGRSANSCKKKVQSLRDALAKDLADREKADKEYIADQSRPWTVEDLTTLYAMKMSGFPMQFIADGLKRGKEECQNKYENTNWANLKDKIPYENQESTEEEKKQYIDKLRKATDTASKKSRINNDLICDAIEKYTKVVRRIDPPKYAPKIFDMNGDLKEEDVVLMLSDAHFGSYYTSDETGGLSEYSLEIAQRRMRNLQYAVKDIYELHSKLYSLSTLNICCLGDMVAGDSGSGAWSAHHIREGIVEQMVLGGEMIIEAISYWLSIFETINFYGVYGNHGRIGKKNQEKPQDNYDRMLFKYVERAFKDNPRVNFHVPETWFIKTEIRGYKFLMVHGEDINSGMSAIKYLKDFEHDIASISREITDYTLSAHFHTSAELATNQGRVMINGSVMGGDIYSLKELRAGSKPEQTLFGVNESRGVTWKYNIDVESEREE